MSTFAEIKRQILLRLDKNDGRAIIVVEQAINDTLHLVASVKDFDELMALDTTHAFTVASQKLYHITTDLLLVRPKDIYSIRYMDEGNSRKLTYVPMRELDSKVPYTELTGEGKPTFYTVRGMYIELYRIPEEAMPLYIQHSQWPALLSADDDEIPFVNIDPVIVALATNMSLTMLEGQGSADWSQMAMQLLGNAVKEDVERPDRFFVARPFSADKGSKHINEYWYDPFVK